MEELTMGARILRRRKEKSMTQETLAGSGAACGSVGGSVRCRSVGGAARKQG